MIEEGSVHPPPNHLALEETVLDFFFPLNPPLRRRAEGWEANKPIVFSIDRRHGSVTSTQRFAAVPVLVCSRRLGPSADS